MRHDHSGPRIKGYTTRVDHGPWTKGDTNIVDYGPWIKGYLKVVDSGSRHNSTQTVAARVAV